MNSDGIYKHTHTYIYSIPEMFLLLCLLADILFLNEEMLLWEGSECAHLTWQNLMVSTKHRASLDCIILYKAALRTLEQASLTMRVGVIILVWQMKERKNRSPERLSKLLQFQQLVSDQTSTTSGGLAWRLVNTGEDKTEGALICQLLSLGRAGDAMFGKRFCCCLMWDL